MKPIDWHNIRTHNGSQREGFEEFCAELAYNEKPSDAKFTRLAAPDGGIECYWEDSDGNRYGWQAKYFNGEFGRTQWKQIDKSVKDALKNYPKLTHYHICVPQNRTGGDETGKSPRKSGMQYWKEYVAKWEKLAKKQGIEIEFEWLGTWELDKRLKKPQHADLRRRWFSELVLDDDWFHTQLKVSLEAASERYERELNVELPIANKLEMLGRTKGYIDGIKSYAMKIRIWQWDLTRSIYPNSSQDDPSLNIDTNELQNLLGIALKQIAELKYEPIGGPTLQDISESIQNAVTAINEFLEDLSKRANEYDTKSEKGQTHRQNPFWERRMQTLRTLNVLQSVLDSIDAEDRRLMIISGAPGTGKTQLLCHIAETRVDDGLPTVLLMGQLFMREPDAWSQTLGHIDLRNESIKTFIGALEDAAQRVGQRALLIIDAINEGDPSVIWDAYLATFLERIDSPWIAVLLSVRSTYKDNAISKQTLNKAIEITHYGYEEKTYEATKKYFARYNLGLPLTPSLQSEFQNPLFLKIFCQGVGGKSGEAQPDKFHGISEVFDLYLEAVNIKLAEKEKLDYDPDDNYVRKALTNIAKYLVDRDEIDGYLRGLDKKTVKNMVDRLLPRDSYEKSLYRGMVLEGLFIENPKLGGQNTDKIVRFSYERFADYVIADFLLQKHLNPDEPKAAFAEGGGLAFLRDEKRYGLRGLIEALSVQVPERTEKELIELVPELHTTKDIFNRSEAIDAFQQSIVWRKLGGFSNTTEEFLERLFESEKKSSALSLGENSVLTILLTVATVPDHPYNAKFLNKLLKRDIMADRDAYWSAYIHNTRNFQGPVDRLIDWALEVSPDVKLRKEVVELASITLTWMLTTPNRFLRDRATKALISLLTGRLGILQNILERFADVNDPYVAERLYAVAYGVVMRSHDVEGVGDVARWVYDNVFVDGKPPAHILFRDYARGVIERALYLESDIKVDEQLIRPPYKSEFPQIPTEKEITELMADWKNASYEGEGKVEWARDRIRMSIMDDDFAWYVIGTNASKFSTKWLSLRLGEPWRSPEARIETLVSQWGETMQKSWQECKDAYGRKKGPWAFFDGTRYKAEGELKIATRNFRDKLNAENLSKIDTILSQWESGKYENPPRFELIHIQRYILKRVFDLGWTIERFWEFDRLEIGYQGRGASKAERIGKKYQWIAYHEVMAYISDHFQYLVGDDIIGKYEGPWRDHFRDIDPSVTLSFNQGGTHWEGHKPSWWADEPYKVWKENELHSVWVKREDDIPEIEKLMSPSDPKNISWLNLRGNFIWRQSDPTKTESTDADVDSRELWLSFTGCFVRNSEIEEFVNWVKKMNSQRNDILPLLERHDEFLGEYGWAPAFRSKYAQEYDWSKPRPDCPVSVRMASFVRSYKSGEFDFSVDTLNDRHCLKLPHLDLIEKLKLRWKGRNAEFIDSKRKRAVYDPVATEEGPESLLFREDLMRSYLKKNGLTLCWLVRGEKMILYSDNDRDLDHPRYRIISGVYTLGSQGPQGELRFYDPPEDRSDTVPRPAINFSEDDIKKILDGVPENLPDDSS